MNESFRVLEIGVDPQLPSLRGELPAELNSIERPPQSTIRPDRTFVLEMESTRRRVDSGRASTAHHASHASMSINGQAMDFDVINERVSRGVWERWRVENDDGHHPFHVHGCSFLVVSQDDRPVSEADAGWKDTVWVDRSVEFLVRFDHEADERFPYMYHCHILEHEDMGMMGQFTVA